MTKQFQTSNNLNHSNHYVPTACCGQATVLQWPQGIFTKADSLEMSISRLESLCSPWRAWWELPWGILSSDYQGIKRQFWIACQCLHTCSCLGFFFGGVFFFWRLKSFFDCLPYWKLLVSNAKKQTSAMFDYSKRVLFSKSSEVSSVLSLVFFKSLL